MTDKLLLRQIDPRTVRLDNDRYLEERDDNGEIIRLYKQNSDIEIKVGDSVIKSRAKHKVNIIVRGASGSLISCYDLKCAYLNTSSIFITPLLGFKRSELFWESNFVNTFLSTTEVDRCIALLYRFSGHKSFIQFEAWIKSQPAFIQAKDVDPYHVMYVFSVPNVGKGTYDLIRKGRYSEIDDVWKLIILSFHGFDRNGKTGQILYKDYKLRLELEQKFDIDIGDAELHSIPDMRYERFDNNYYSTNDARSKKTTGRDIEKRSME